ncbi:hypothetical protein [Desulforhopalus sp. 52FAK]
MKKTSLYKCWKIKLFGEGGRDKWVCQEQACGFLYARLREAKKGNTTPTINNMRMGEVNCRTPKAPQEFRRNVVAKVQLILTGTLPFNPNLQHSSGYHCTERENKSQS